MADQFIASELSAFKAKYPAAGASNTVPRGPAPGESKALPQGPTPGSNRVQLTLTQFSSSESSSESEDDEPIAQPQVNGAPSAFPYLDRLQRLGFM